MEGYFENKEQDIISRLAEHETLLKLAVTKDEFEDFRRMALALKKDLGEIIKHLEKDEPRFSSYC